MRLVVPRRLLVLSFLLGIASAEAAVPVVLPPTETPADWSSALAVGDLVLAPAGAGASVTIVVGKDSWILRVRDQRGNVQELNVLPPATSQDREDMLWLATDLLKQAGAFLAPTPVAAPAAPAPPPAPAKPAAPPPAPVPPPAPAKPAAPPPAPVPPPAPAKPAAPPPAPVPPPAPAKPAAPPPAPVPPPAPAKPAAPPPAPVPGAPANPASVSWWAELGAGAGLRSATATGLDLRLGGGARLGEHLGLGLTVDVRPASQIEGLGEGRTVSTTDLGLGAWWSLAGRVQPTFGGLLGASSQAFREGGESVGIALVPFMGVEAGVAVPLAAGVSLRPLVSARAALRPVAIETPTTTVDLGRVDTRAVLALSYRPAPSTK